MKKIFIIVILLLFVSLKVSSQQDSRVVWHGEDLKYSIYNDSIAFFYFNNREMVFRQTINNNNILTLNQIPPKSCYVFKIWFQSPDSLILEPFDHFTLYKMGHKNKLIFINQNSLKDDSFNFNVVTYRKKDPKEIIYIDSTGLIILN